MPNTIQFTLDRDDAVEALIILEALRRIPPRGPQPRLERIIAELGRALEIPVRPTHKPTLVK